MKEPSRRQTLAIGTNRGHAVFKSESDSIEDLLLWFGQYGVHPWMFNTPQEYVNFLASKAYFEDSPDNYLAGMINGLKNYA